MGDALVMVFLATCRLAEQFLQAMAGVESMTVAISPADNSLIVVIELPLWIQQISSDYPSRAGCLHGAAITSNTFSPPASGAPFNMHPHLRPPFNALPCFMPVIPNAF